MTKKIDFKSLTSAEVERIVDKGLRHRSGKTPSDYLDHFLYIARHFAFATHDDSWGEFEKEFAIIISRLVRAETLRRTFQSRVVPWMLLCFGPVIPMNKTERNHRFFEEATELVQSLDMSREDAHRLVDYVYGRPIGEPAQEVGGVMVTLAALCHANDLDMAEAGETELARINEPAVVERIRLKQATKPKHGPLPV
jgi:hypothetical protein